MELSGQSIQDSDKRRQPPYPLHRSVADRIDGEYAAFYEAHIADKQQVHLQPISASRASGILIPGAGPLLDVGRIADHSIRRVESVGPDVQVRAFTPPDADADGRPPGGWPVLIWFHGGGWVLGNLETEQVVARNLCARARVVVVSVDYRLAPEAPFPAAVEDAWEAVLWVAAGPGRSALGVDAARLAVGGSSAGGNLAAVMCQRAAARGERGERGERGPRVVLQLLSVPVVDNAASADTRTSWGENEHAPALPAEKMLWFRRHYLPREADWTHAEASPLFWDGDWTALPTAVMVLGELDVLRSEGEAFAAKLAAAGVRTDVHVMKGQPHPFIAMDGVLEAGRRAIGIFCDALRDTMYPG